MNIPKYMYIVTICFCLLVLSACGAGTHWREKLDPGAEETSAWMAGGRWNRCARGDYAGRHISYFTEAKTCVPDPKGGRICTFYYYYSNDGVYNLKTWYQQRYDMYVDDNGYIKGCVCREYQLGVE